MIRIKLLSLLLIGAITMGAADGTACEGSSYDANSGDTAYTFASQEELDASRDSLSGYRTDKFGVAISYAAA